MGRHLMVPWVLNTPGWKKLMRDPYRKRWPKYSQLCVRFFAEFCLKGYTSRTLLETASTLPLAGVACKFFRAPEADHPDTRGKYFIASSVEFTQRPFRGKLQGTQFIAGRPVMHGIAPVGKTLGKWRYEFPDGAHPVVYRPPFPEMRGSNAKDDSAE